MMKVHAVERGRVWDNCQSVRGAQMEDSGRIENGCTAALPLLECVFADRSCDRIRRACALAFDQEAI